MIFTAPLFLFILLPVIIGATLLIPGKYQNITLFVFSIALYGIGQWTHPIGILLLAGMLFFTWIMGKLLAKKPSPLLCLLGVSVNFAFVIAYRLLFRADLVLPLGIALLALHAVSYLLDVYRQDTKMVAESNLVRLGTYLFFFPALIAGPVLQYRTFAPQLKNRTFSVEKVSLFVKYFAIGFIKKVAIAATLATVTDRIFAPSAVVSPMVAWIGVIILFLQIFYELSSFSDMGKGLGFLFGFELEDNYKNPFQALGILDFTQRFFLTLRSWMLFYVIEPLTKQFPKAKILIYYGAAIGLGLWLDLRVNTVVFAIFIATFLLLEEMVFPRFLDKSRIGWKIGSCLYTYLVMGIGWIFLRSESFGDAIRYLGAMIGIYSQKNPILLGEVINQEVFMMTIFAIIALLPWKKGLEKMEDSVNNRKLSYLSQAVVSIILIITFSFTIFYFMPQYSQYATAAYSFLTL